MSLGLGADPVFSGNTVTRNRLAGLELIDERYEGTYTLGHRDFAGALDVPYLIYSDLSIEAGGSLTIDPGIVLKFEDHDGLIVRGTLNAAGTEGDSYQ